MSAGQNLEEAHSHAAKATGQMSLMLEKKRLRRAEIERVARHLREALRLVESGVLGARAPKTTDDSSRTL